MDVNMYSIYSVVSTAGKNTETDIQKVLNTTAQLEEFKDCESVKKWLKDNWNIRDDVRNFAISPNVRLSVRNGKRYFNVTVEFEEEVKSYNYNK